MKATKILVKWGGSLGITVPDDIVKSMKLKKGDLMEIDIKRSTEEINHGDTKKIIKT